VVLGPLIRKFPQSSDIFQDASKALKAGFGHLTAFKPVGFIYIDIKNKAA
jgi:hypothetical protein